MANGFRFISSDAAGKAAVGAGALAGLIAGAGMILFAMVVSAARGDGFWFPAQLIGAVLYGVDSILGGTGPAITGLILHFALSAALGALFGTMITRLASTGAAIAGGIAFGCGTWVIMTYAVIPWLDSTLYERTNLMPYWWFGFHLFYGAILGSTPALLRATAPETAEIREGELGRAA